jgi:hypothetical protein
MRTRLALAYTGVALGILRCVVLIDNVAANELIASRLPDILQRGLAQRAPQAGPYLATRPPDTAGAAVWLDRNGDTVLAWSRPISCGRSGPMAANSGAPSVVGQLYRSARSSISGGAWARSISEKWTIPSGSGVPSLPLTSASGTARPRHTATPRVRPALPRTMATASDRLEPIRSSSDRCTSSARRSQGRATA